MWILISQQVLSKQIKRRSIYANREKYVDKEPSIVFSVGPMLIRSTRSIAAYVKWPNYERRMSNILLWQMAHILPLYMLFQYIRRMPMATSRILTITCVNPAANLLLATHGLSLRRRLLVMRFYLPSMTAIGRLQYPCWSHARCQPYLFHSNQLYADESRKRQVFHAYHCGCGMV